MTPLTPPASSPPAPGSPTLGGCARLPTSRTKPTASHQVHSSELTPPRDRYLRSSLYSNTTAAGSTEATQSEDTFEDVFLTHTEYAPRRVLPSSDLTRYLIASLTVRKTPRVLITSVPGNLFNRIRTTLLRNNLKYSYSGDTGTLSLQRMPESGIHAALGVFASRMRMDMQLEGFVTREEGNLLECTAIPWKLPSGRYTPAAAVGNRKLKKRAASDKVPDMAYYLRDATFASVVWECGWSEDYDDLVSDARQWLEKGGGHTKMVVIAKISVDRKVERRMLEERRRELIEEEGARREEKRRRRKLKTQQQQQQYEKHGDDKESTEEDDDLDMRDINGDQSASDSEPDIDPDASFSSNSSDRSTPSDYQALRTHAQHNHHLWQAPVTCILELWAWNPSTRDAYKHGPTYDVYPNHSPGNPRISRADILPHIVGDAVPFTPAPDAPPMEMEFELKLEVLKACLEAGIRQQAFAVMTREWKKVRGGGKRQSDDEWGGEDDE